jgi:hypothetical protein
MADRAELQETVRGMRTARRDHMYELARRDAAMAILDETGEVSTAAVDRRLEATWVEPDAATLDNMAAAKAAAALAFEHRQRETLIEAVARAERGQVKAQANLDMAAAALTEARAALDDHDNRLGEARELVAIAAEGGNADAAPQGQDVVVHAEPATALATAPAADEPTAMHTEEG